MGDSIKKSDFAIATPPNEADLATLSTSYFSAMEEQIERSKVHWSMLTDNSGDMDKKKVEFQVSNEEEFRDLQRHPTWGDFFQNFTGDCISTGSYHDDLGELVVGKKFAEGAQAELFEVEIKWSNLKNFEDDKRLKRECVLKVFKEGALLKDVKSQLPQGLLRRHVESLKNRVSPIRKRLPQYISNVYGVVLLKDGRFAFRMRKQHYDLRTLIEGNVKLKSGAHCGPFSKVDAPLLMYEVALGVEWLHNHDIVHRDLKASNVLVRETKSSWREWRCFVADYECSIGVIGTSFFRAPEILQACKERKVHKRPEVFSRSSDVYSFGMICYEILTGKLPFEDHPLNDNPFLMIDLVINQHLCPEVPQYIDEWARELLCRCWQFDPPTRPSIGEILNVLLASSAKVRNLEVYLKKRYGENYRS